MSYLNNSRYQVKTPTGWQDFDGIKKSRRQGLIKLTCASGRSITTTPEHKVKNQKGDFVYVKDLYDGCLLFDDVVKSIELLDYILDDVYDLINVKNGHEYYTNGIISSNCAFIRDFDTIWTGLYPTLTTGGNAILISSPNGVGGLYYRLWVEAEAGTNEFNPIRLPWTVHPEHDEAWFIKETRNLPKRKVSQEYLCDFITSGDTFLQSEDLEDLRSMIRPPLEKTGFDRNIWVWEQPILEKSYVISADVARGDAADYSSFHVLDQKTCEVVAEYMGKIPPEKFADVLAEWGKKYNNALLCPENNTFGYFVNVKLRDTGYPRIYYHNHRGDALNYTPLNQDELPGFPTNQKTRVQILTKLEELIRNKTLKCYSQRLYDQLQAFIWNGNKPMASKDSHDDLIMSLAIGTWLTEGGTGTNDAGYAMAMAMLKATGISSVDARAIPNNPTYTLGANAKGQHQINQSNVYKLREASQVKHLDPKTDHGMDDLSWLYK